MRFYRAVHQRIFAIGAFGVGFARTGESLAEELAVGDLLVSLKKVRARRDSIDVMLGTPGGNGIVFQKVPAEVAESLERAFRKAKAEYGQFEASIIALPDEDAYNLQIHMPPDKTFLKERISRDNPVTDFEKVVSERLGG